jgi:hypothetical protein
MIKIPCPACRGHAIDEPIPEKPWNPDCTYCDKKGEVSYLKHLFVMGEHKKIKRVKRFIKMLNDFKKNKELNNSL